MKKVPGKYFWLLMTITGALMFGAPALVSASEGTASTDTENSAADNDADTTNDNTTVKTTDSTENNSQETDHSGEGQISKPKYLENAENNGEEIISDEDPIDNTYGYYTIMVEQLFPSMKCVHYTTVRDALTHLKNSVAAEHLI